MAKFNAAKIEECEAWITTHGLIDYGGAMLKEYCRVMGIDEKTHRLWMKKPQYKEAVIRAKDTFKQNLTHDLAVSLAQAAKGYDREETEQEFRPDPNTGQPIPVKMKKKKIHIQANVGAAIFLLTNLDPEHYQNRQRNDVMLKKEDDKPMTLEEINAEIERLEKLDK